MLTHSVECVTLDEQVVVSLQIVPNLDFRTLALRVAQLGGETLVL